MAEFRVPTHGRYHPLIWQRLDEKETNRCPDKNMEATDVSRSCTDTAVGSVRSHLCCRSDNKRPILSAPHSRVWSRLAIHRAPYRQLALPTLPNALPPQRPVWARHAHLGVLCKLWSAPRRFILGIVGALYAHKVKSGGTPSESRAWSSAWRSGGRAGSSWGNPWPPARAAAIPFWQHPDAY